TTVPSHDGFTQVPDYTGSPLGDIVEVLTAGTSTNYTSTTPPSIPPPPYQITIGTNTTYITNSSNPGSSAPGLSTNVTVRINQTNRTVTMTASNLICSAGETT